MQAYYEIATYIPSNHQLPIDVNLALFATYRNHQLPEGKVKIAIIYELPDVQANKTTDLISAIKNFRVNKPLSAQDIKSLCEEGRA
jgi:hypothetical protein